ncbi:hypothetical protein I4U23_020266 [Adineta vaga]|nr:hypothetical protein I4U23_020266 [Adineta vaga]
MYHANDFSSIAWSKESLENKSDTDSNLSETADGKQGKLSSSKHTRMICSTMMAIIILIIIIIIAITVPLLYINKTTKQTNKLPNNDPTVTESSSIGTPIIYEVGEGGTSNDAPCSSHTVINDPLRNVAATGIGGTCDSGSFFDTSIGGRWIRFVGTGGTMIPMTPTGFMRCGAYLTVWFNGTLPSTSNAIVNTNACVDLQTGVCAFPIEISIVKCIDFYVYFLRPLLMCNARYCTT